MHFVIKGCGRKCICADKVIFILSKGEYLRVIVLNYSNIQFLKPLASKTLQQKSTFDKQKQAPLTEQEWKQAAIGICADTEPKKLKLFHFIVKVPLNYS